MPSEIELHRTAIKTIFTNFSGITKAFDVVPEKLDTAELPALWSFTGQAPHNETLFGQNILSYERIYRIQVAVLPTGQATPTLRELKVAPLIESVSEELEAYPMLKNTAGVQEAKVMSDSGIVILPEFGASFVGFEIRLQVKYFHKRIYKE